MSGGGQIYEHSEKYNLFSKEVLFPPEEEEKEEEQKKPKKKTRKKK